MVASPDRMQELSMCCQQFFASSPELLMVQGQLAAVLDNCIHLPKSWSQAIHFRSLLEQALDMLQHATHGSSASMQSSEADADVNIHSAMDDQDVKQHALLTNASCLLQHQQQQQKQCSAPCPEPGQTLTSISEQIAALTCGSSSAALQLHVLEHLQRQVAAEAVGSDQNDHTPFCYAVIAAGGLNCMLQLLTCRSSNSSSNDSNCLSQHQQDDTCCHTSSCSNRCCGSPACNTDSNSIKVHIAASKLLLALTDGHDQTNRRSWVQWHIRPQSVPALVQLVLHNNALAKRAAELLTTIAQHSARHSEIAEAGGIAALLHVLSEGCSKRQHPLNCSTGQALRRPYAVLAAAAAALESLTHGPVEVQSAIADAGGVEVLEAVCESLLAQQMGRK